MKDVETIFKNADFSKGTDHKERLKTMLNGLENGVGQMPLSDEELELAAAGRIDYQKRRPGPPKY